MTFTNENGRKLICYFANRLEVDFGLSIQSNVKFSRVASARRLICLPANNVTRSVFVRQFLNCTQTLF